MAALEKVIERICQIAERRNNTTTSDIEWVVNQLREHGFQVREPRRTRHGVLYGVGPVGSWSAHTIPAASRSRVATWTIF
jgi:hypothetical protein